jgi:hypothetical protein
MDGLLFGHLLLKLLLLEMVQQLSNKPQERSIYNLLLLVYMTSSNGLHNLSPLITQCVLRVLLQ